jgi:hypothetical protein
MSVHDINLALLRKHIYKKAISLRKKEALH